MAYCFRVFHDLKLVYRRTWGVYDDLEMQSAHAQWRLLTSAGITHNYDALMDTTDVSEYRVTAAAIRAQARSGELAWQVDDGQRAVRIAYLAPKPNAFGTGRMLGVLIGDNGANLRVFNSLPEAGAWLGLSLALLELIRDKGVRKTGDAKNLAVKTGQLSATSGSHS